MSKGWSVLLCKSKELQLLGTLNGGQSFRWKNTVIDGKENWIGVFASKVWFLQQKEDKLLYKTYGNTEKTEDDAKLLCDYFQLDLNLEEHFEKWSQADPNFKKITEQFHGIRILKQHPVENIFSFICSSNNHITRISNMVENLAKFYGNMICEVNGVTYYDFPAVDKLSDESVELKLRENGFGYRAKYICNSAKLIVNSGGDTWLKKLKTLSYEDAKRELMTLTGVGAKVADCICLMSLGHLQAIPVDTHVYQIAVRDYLPKLANKKTVTDKIYAEIGDHFRSLYGPLAGWAQTVLFCADLTKFQGSNKRSAESKGKSRKKR